MIALSPEKWVPFRNVAVHRRCFLNPRQLERGQRIHSRYPIDIGSRFRYIISISANLTKCLTSQLSIGQFADRCIGQGVRSAQGSITQWSPKPGYLYLQALSISPLLTGAPTRVSGWSALSAIVTDPGKLIVLRPPTPISHPLF